ncbi:hypothetical protein SAMN04489732_1552 [Amycolatopsis saalfeldensis]|uniref:Uncharacterized protein n=1 Tax=Amycolatopsis saalfeldensis TaxID=394193 RepID=A0A1H8YQV7_9PSEU|nr:hypothetical protein SAMN04489732_1552 [Amycolatopsis saalfeldensis]
MEVLATEYDPGVDDGASQRQSRVRERVPAEPVTQGERAAGGAGQAIPGDGADAAGGVTEYEESGGEAGRAVDIAAAAAQDAEA